MQNQRTDANREHEPEARSQNAEIRKPCCAPPCIDRISSFIKIKKNPPEIVPCVKVNAEKKRDKQAETRQKPGY
jgi:hypothetical protein